MCSKAVPGPFLCSLFVSVWVLRTASRHVQSDTRIRCTTYVTQRKALSSVLQITVAVVRNLSDNIPAIATKSFLLVLLFITVSLHVSAPTGHPQVNTIYWCCYFITVSLHVSAPNGPSSSEYIILPCLLTSSKKLSLPQRIRCS
jgi:hypothetical protein